MIKTRKRLVKAIENVSLAKALQLLLSIVFTSPFLHSQPLLQGIFHLPTLGSSQEPFSQYQNQLQLQLQNQSQTQDHSPSIEPLLFWHGGKLLISGLTLGTALTDPDLSQEDRTLVAGTGVLLAIPAIGVLRNTVTRNTTAIRNWRVVGFVIDLGLSATLISLGVRQAIDQSPSNDWNAVASMSIGGLGVLLSGLNLLPLRIETVSSVKLTTK